MSFQRTDGLAGVLGDSLPDGWGRLLFDRMIGLKECFHLIPIQPDITVKF